MKPSDDVRGSGSFDNPGLRNLNIAKGCDRMVERLWGHIEGVFQDLFSVRFLLRTFLENRV